MRIRERGLLGATCVLAVATPLALAHHLDRKVQRELAPAMTRLTGQPVTVGGVEADLTGVVRLRDVVVGDLLRADAIEGAVSLDSLLAGELGADEIRVHRPRVAVHVERDGRSDWHEMLERVASRLRGRASTGGGGKKQRLRRVVVSGGDLVADVGDMKVALRDVALHPQAGGVRLVTGTATITGGVGPYHVDSSFGRVGADVRLPALAVDRVVAVGGRGSLRAPGSATLSAAAGELVRDRPDGAWRLRAEVDDGGAPRPVELTLARDPAATTITIRGDRVPLAAMAPLVPTGVGVERAHASGTVTAVRGAGMSIRGELTVDGAWLDHAAIAEAPVPIDGTVTIDASASGARVDVETLQLKRGGLALTISGWARLDGHRPVALDATAALAPAPCRALVDAIPEPLRGPLDQLVVDGTLAGAAHVAFDLDDRAAAEGEGVRLALDLDPRTCRVVADPPAADPARLTGAAEHRFPDGHTALVGPGLGAWVDLGDLPSHVRGAFVAAEDARFWDHGGFDLDQIARSLEVDLRERRFARGGSTISQQLVKNAFLDHRRTLTRKLQEAVLTWRLEAVLDKRAILARYLNVIELGPGVFGIGAAARHYFDKPADDLDVEEAAFLAALTPAPRTMSARLRRHRGLDPETAERVQVVLRAMRRAGVIDPATAREAAGRALDFRRSLFD